MQWEYTISVSGGVKMCDFDQFLNVYFFLDNFEYYFSQRIVLLQSGILMYT